VFNCDHSIRHAHGQEIHILHQFRDEYMLTNPLGRALVDIYYRISPPIAEFITQHPVLKTIVRVGLLPAVAISTIVVNTTQAQKIAIIGLVALVSVALAVWITKQRGRYPEYTPWRKRTLACFVISSVTI
jgi:hypothetical protein